MDTAQLIGSIFFALAGAFFMSGIAYQLSSLLGADNQYYKKDNELFLFKFLSTWNLVVGLYFFSYKHLVEFFTYHHYVFIIACLYCTLLAGPYFFKFKQKYNKVYDRLEVLFNWFDLFGKIIAANLNSETIVLGALLNRLFSYEKAIENFNNQDKPKWLMRFWKLIKIYILNIKD